MKSMLAVAELISKQKLRKIDILTEDILNSKNSKFKELYMGLRDGTMRNDREAAQKLYGAAPSDSRYRQLKSRFRKRLLNTLFFVDQNRPHRTSFDQTYHNCQRDWSLINILRVNGAEAPSLQMAKSLLTTCQSYGFAELTVQTARYLANDAANKGDFKSSDSLQSIIEDANQIYQIELKSEDILRRARLLFVKACASNDCMEINQKVNELQEESDRCSALSESALLYYNHLETSCILARILHDKTTIIKLVDEAVNYSKASPRQMQETRLFELCTWQLETYIELGQTREGLAALSQMELRLKAGSKNWFETQKLKLVLFIRSGELEQAQGCFKKTFGHRNFKKLSAQELESFRLLEMLVLCFEETLPQKMTSVQKNTIDAFLRKDATFGGDLQGLNAWRLLIKATLQRRLGLREELSETIANFRHLSVKRLDAKFQSRLIATSQLLYRLERKDFKGGIDRVGERYFHQIESSNFQCSLRSVAFNPIDVEDLLAFFGVNEFSALPA